MHVSDSGRVESLFTFPIKGLSPVRQQHVALVGGQGFPGDRLFGFAKGNSGFDAEHPKPLPKDRFLVLMQHAKIAGLKTSFDPATYKLVVENADRVLLRADLRTEAGKADASEFFVDYLDLDEAETPFFASAAPHRFTDVSVVSETMMNAVSFINLASVRDFEERIETAVDPGRFRANIVFDGWPAFAEFDLVDTIVRVGDVSFKILMRTKRCAATEVNPETAERDLKLPALLRQSYGHFDMGVYAEVVSDGEIKVGDPVVAAEV